MQKDKLSLRQNFLALTVLATSIFFLNWAILVKTNNALIQHFDSYFIKIITSEKLLDLATIKQITVIGNTKTMVILSIIVTIILIFAKRPWLGAWFSLTMAASTLTNTIIKLIVTRPRPTVPHLVYAGGYSFPSGHSVGSMTFFLLLITLALIFIKNKIAKTILAILLGLMPLLIGASRIYLHVHYPSDVLGGFVLAIIFVLLSLFALKKLKYFLS